MSVTRLGEGLRTEDEALAGVELEEGLSAIACRQVGGRVGGGGGGRGSSISSDRIDSVTSDETVAQGNTPAPRMPSRWALNLVAEPTMHLSQEMHLYLLAPPPVVILSALSVKCFLTAAASVVFMVECRGETGVKKGWLDESKKTSR